MQQDCQVCHKSVNYERGAVEVACPFCYTEYRIDGMGRLKMVDLFEEEDTEVEAAPDAPDRGDMARLLDDGADQHITFIKDTSEAKRPAPASKKPPTTPPVIPTGDPGSLEFADDDDTPKQAAPGVTFSDLTSDPKKPAAARKKKPKKAAAAGPGPQQARPTSSGKEREERPVQRKKRRKQKQKSEALANHPHAFDIPDDMPEDDDANQRALVGVVVVIVGVILFGALSAVGVIMLSGNSDSGDTTRQADDDEDSSPDAVAASNGDEDAGDNASGTAGGSRGLDDVVRKAEELLDAGTYEDAREAVLWLETASESGELNAAHRRRLDTTLTGARQACNAWWLYEQGVAAVDRADAATDEHRASFERHFALGMLREASTAARRGPGFNALRDKINAATARARAN